MMAYENFTRSGEDAAARLPAPGAFSDFEPGALIEVEIEPGNVIQITLDPVDESNTVVTYGTLEDGTPFAKAVGNTQGLGEWEFTVALSAAVTSDET